MSELITHAGSTSLLKRVYRDGPPAHTALQISKFLAEVRKDTAYEGEDYRVTVTIAAGSGVSADFATAKANMSATSERQFALGYRTLYSLCAIEGPAVRMSRTNKGSLARLLDHNVRNTTEKFNRALSAQITSSAGGSLTRLTTATTVTNTYFTCAPTSHASRFEVNDYLQLASDDGTGAAPTALRTGRVRVTGVTYATGVIAVTPAISTGIVGAVNTDYVFREGDYGKAFTGIQGWVPITAPAGGDSFKGVNRSVCENKLAGLRFVGAGRPRLETIRDALADMAMTGANPDRLYTNPRDFSCIQGELGDKSWIALPNANPKLGHRGLSYESPAGSLIIVSEPWIPEGYAWPLKLDTWTLHTAGECPSILNEDGTGRLHRLEGADAYELRIGAYGELECSEPGQNGVITWA